MSRVHEVLNDTESHLQLVHDFTCDGQHFEHSTPFPRYSALHCFLEYLIRELLTDDTLQVDLSQRQAMFESVAESPEDLEDLDPRILPIEEALKHHGFDYQPFTDWLKHREKRFEDADQNDIGDYLDNLQLEETFDKLLIQSVREAFYILFGNRWLLLHFNDMMAKVLSIHADEEIPDEYAGNFAKPGVLERVRLPIWVKRPVFFRDRGRCVACGVNLSGLQDTWPDEHFDHLVPLAAGGLNDVTNIQLLCGTCNRKIRTSLHLDVELV